MSAVFLGASFVWSNESISDDELREALQDVEQATGKTLVKSFSQPEQLESIADSVIPKHIYLSWLTYSTDFERHIQYFDSNGKDEIDYTSFMPTYLHRFHGEYKNCFPTTQVSTYIPSGSKKGSSTIYKEPKDQARNHLRFRPVDDREWEKVSDKSKTLQVWRRPCLHLPDIYEHLVCGTFEDITARSFFEVQTNLEYRKVWDPDTLLLEVLDQDVGNAQLIRWIVRFPLGMSPREYVFVRRLAVDDSNQILLFLNKITDANVQTYPMSDFRDVVRVFDYRSTMVVQPHKTFDEPGFDYFLLYYDNPRINVRASWFNWAAASAIPKFMEEVHKAALHLERNASKFQEMSTKSSSTITNIDLTSF